jgi:predicted enzyme related to lactoylglutathione lyase
MAGPPRGSGQIIGYVRNNRADPALRRVRDNKPQQGRFVMANPFVYVELTTADLGRAKDFYGSLFGWQLDDVETSPRQPYTMIRPGGAGTGGGILAQPGSEGPSQWTAYVGVDDIRAATETARALGAEVITEPMEMKHAGWLAVIRDPAGAILGLWQENPAKSDDLPIEVGV